MSDQRPAVDRLIEAVDELLQEADGATGSRLLVRDGPDLESFRKVGDLDHVRALAEAARREREAGARAWAQCPTCANTGWFQLSDGTRARCDHAMRDRR